MKTFQHLLVTVLAIVVVGLVPAATADQELQLATDAGATPTFEADRFASCPLVISGDVEGLDQIVFELEEITGQTIDSVGEPTISVNLARTPKYKQGITTLSSADGVMNPVSIAIKHSEDGNLALLRHEIGHAFSLDHSVGGLMDADAAISNETGDWNADEKAWIAAVAARSCN